MDQFLGTLAVPFEDEALVREDLKLAFALGWSERASAPELEEAAPTVWEKLLEDWL